MRIFETAPIQIGREVEEATSVCSASEWTISLKIRLPLQGRGGLVCYSSQHPLASAGVNCGATARLSAPRSWSGCVVEPSTEAMNAFGDGDAGFPPQLLSRLLVGDEKLGVPG